jgi:hypothetical protein
LARDPRVLGVAVRRIALRQGTRFRIIEAADPALIEGFHAYEPENGLRWTNGDARLPTTLFDGFDGPMELVLHVGSTTQYPYVSEAVGRVVAQAWSSERVGTIRSVSACHFAPTYHPGLSWLLFELPTSEAAR